MILYRRAPNKAALLDGVATGRAPPHPRPRPPARRAAAGPPAVGHPARAPPARHPAPPRRRPGAAHPGRVQRARRPAHLPRPVRVPARPRPQRAEELIDNPDETDDLLGLGLHRLPIGEFPLLRGRAPVLSYDGAAELERGLDILLAGLTATLALPDQAPAPAVRALRRPTRFRAPGDPLPGKLGARADLLA